MAALVHEIWETTEDGMVLHTCCMAGSLGAACRETLASNSRLLITFVAGCHFDETQTTTILSICGTPRSNISLLRIDRCQTIYVGDYTIWVAQTLIWRWAARLWLMCFDYSKIAIGVHSYRNLIVELNLYCFGLAHPSVGQSPLYFEVCIL